MTRFYPFVICTNNCGWQDIDESQQAEEVLPDEVVREEEDPDEMREIDQQLSGRWDK